MWSPWSDAPMIAPDSVIARGAATAPQACAVATINVTSRHCLCIFFARVMLRTLRIAGRRWRLVWPHSGARIAFLDIAPRDRGSACGTLDKLDGSTIRIQRVTDFDAIPRGARLVQADRR
jgi:hypothetical protein